MSNPFLKQLEGVSDFFKTNEPTKPEFLMPNTTPKEIETSNSNSVPAISTKPVANAASKPDVSRKTAPPKQNQQKGNITNLLNKYAPTAKEEPTGASYSINMNNSSKSVTNAPQKTQSFSATFSTTTNASNAANQKIEYFFKKEPFDKITKPIDKTSKPIFEGNKGVSGKAPTTMNNSKNLQGAILKTTAPVSNNSNEGEEDDFDVNMDEIERILEETKNFNSQKFEKTPEPPANSSGAYEMESEFNRIDNNRKVKKNWIIPDVREWTRNFPWDEEIDEIRKNLFGIPYYRNNQRAIINVAKSRKDVFVCMPTGGGKSLTYQLPAITDIGVTVVVMPLLSLIHDQVSQVHTLGICAMSMTGDQKINFNEIRENIVKGKINAPKLIFLTPEKLESSQATISFLQSLYEKNLLARIVIDEAHCVSHWGRDFRQDYLKLGSLKGRFPSVPTMALTATATDLVRSDVIENLRMKDCIYFQCSFNRPNLIYEVWEKKKREDENVNMIADFIKRVYPKQTGLIYCSTTGDCEDIAKKLKLKYDISAAYYHGKMKDSDKNKVQDDWQNDEIKVICATIAFGMGINKPDVRYVIHYSFSKSIENYYQESGRAGRDQRKSHCIILYKNGDRQVLLSLIKNNQYGDNSSKSDLNAHINRMIKFCEDKINCRRQMQINYFGEKFDRIHCGEMCDNCKNKGEVVEFDYTNEARVIARELYFLSQDNLITKNQLVNVLLGKSEKGGKSNSWKFNFEKSDMCGLLKDRKKQEVEELLTEMMAQEYLYEKMIKKFKYPCFYIFIKKTKVDSINKDKLIIRTVVNKPGANQKASNGTEDRSDYTFSKTKTIQTEKFQKYIGKDKAQEQKNQKPQTPENNKKEVEKKAPQIIWENPSKADASVAPNNSLMNFNEYTYNKKGPKSPQDPLKTQDPASEKKLEAYKRSGKSFMYDEKLGYLTEEQFEELSDRLKITRKHIYNRLKDDPKVEQGTNIDNILPLSVIAELCKKLPTSEDEINQNNIKNVGKNHLETLKKYGKTLVSEIKHYIELIDLNKNDFFVWTMTNEDEKKYEVFDMMENLVEERNLDNPLEGKDEIVDIDNLEFPDDSGSKIKQAIDQEDNSDDDFGDEIDMLLQNYEENKTATPNNKSDISFSDSKLNCTTSEKQLQNNWNNVGSGKRKDDCLMDLDSKFFKKKKESLDFI